MSYLETIIVGALAGAIVVMCAQYPKEAAGTTVYILVAAILMYTIKAINPDLKIETVAMITAGITTALVMISTIIYGCCIGRTNNSKKVESDKNSSKEVDSAHNPKIEDEKAEDVESTKKQEGETELSKNPVSQLSETEDAQLSNDQKAPQPNSV